QSVRRETLRADEGLPRQADGRAQQAGGGDLRGRARRRPRGRSGARRARMTAPRQNEAELRRLEALRLAMAGIVPFLDDDRVIEIALNADGAVWVERVGERMARTPVRMSPADANRMLMLVAHTMNTEIGPAKPSLAAL